MNARHFFRHARKASAFMAPSSSFNYSVRLIVREQMLASKLQMTSSLNLGLVRSSLIINEEQESDSPACQDDGGKPCECDELCRKRRR